jgi:hypothetical protein
VHELKTSKPVPRNGRFNKFQRVSEESAAPSFPEYKSLVLTLYNSTGQEKLPAIEEVLGKYKGDCPVYLKIVSEKEWETILSTDRQVDPSKEMMVEIKNILGEESTALN